MSTVDKEISDWYILESSNSMELTERVNINIKEGWHPHGNIVVVCTNYSTTKYIQVMVKY